ncbi:MAG TPA: DUF1688 family protein [Aestuariivirgaceae bacterium]|nr:DUF1688 family protein [Aestuariivirgaceae bacterium]
MGDDQPDSAADVAADVAWLTSPLAVAERCTNIFEAGRAGDLEHFRIVEERLGEAARYVAGVINARHPKLDVPPHSRWRHFEVGGTDLWLQLAATLDEDAYGLARIRFDLAVTSVLLDAGAGPDWRYRHAASGTDLSRSEGLAIASFEAFQTGFFSSDPRRPLMADAEGLASLTEDSLAAAFQVSPANPLPGLANRVALLRKLGESLTVHGEARPAALFDRLAATSEAGAASVLDLFADLQRLIGPIWPGRLELDGVNLGDTWPHPKAGGKGPTAGLVPFHKLGQWMCYSLLEPAEDAGLRFADVTVLTPLAEYRNGGLVVDLGLIEPRHARVLGEAHRPGDEIVVEWRALTIPIILAIADRLRQYFAVDADRLPLAAVLEGGTWWAGRRIAAEKRPGGPPPIRVVSDGTVF